MIYALVNFRITLACMIRAEKGISWVIAKLKTTVTENKAEITKLKTPLAQETEKNDETERALAAARKRIDEQ